MTPQNKYHLAEVVSGHGADALVKVNPVGMRWGQTLYMSRVYNYLAEEGDRRVVIIPCRAPELCCVPGDADISERALGVDAFVDVLGRGVEFTGTL